MAEVGLDNKYYFETCSKWHEEVKLVVHIAKQQSRELW